MVLKRKFYSKIANYKITEPVQLCFLLQNTLGEIERMVEFLGLPLDQELLSEIANKSQFQEMKEGFKKRNFGDSLYKTSTGYGFMRKGKEHTRHRYISVCS